VSGALKVTADPRAVSMAGAIRTAAAASPLLVLAARALVDLAEELGGMDAAVLRLLELAEANDRPIAANFVTGIGTSSTAFIAPRHWSEERLAG
jgi:hypothetical protein